MDTIYKRREYEGLSESRKYFKKYLEIAKNNNLEENFYRYLGLDLKYKAHRSLVEYLLNNEKTTLNIEGYIYNNYKKVRKKLKIIIDTHYETVLKNQNIKWVFAKLKKEYKLSPNYNAKKSDILLFSYKVENSKFGDLFVFRFLNSTSSSIVLTKDEFYIIKELQ